MYEFIDTVTRILPGNDLPSEALSINGSYIENQISGYRTLSVSGRELLSASVNSYEVGNTTGSYYRRKKFGSRNIKVKYQIISHSPESFREKFNLLNQILDFEQAQLVFNDEDDKYFIGTKAGNEEIESGKNSVVGEFTIFCADPKKYSLTRKEVIATQAYDENENPILGLMQATFENEGTIPASIDYEIEHHSENGYVGIIGEGAVMQYGYLDEADTEERIQSRLLFNGSNGRILEYPPAGSMTYIDEWHDNVTGITGHAQSASLLDSDHMPGDLTNTRFQGKNVLMLRTNGSNSDSWPSGNRLFKFKNYTPTGSSETVGPFVNFSAVAHCWFEASAKQQGFLEMGIVNDSNKLIARIMIIKRNTGNSNITYEYGIYKNNTLQTVKKGSITATKNGDAGRTKKKKWGADCQIIKSGGVFTFSFAYHRFSISVPELASVGARGIILEIGRKGGNKYVPPVMCWIDAKFTSDNVQYTYNIPNRYQDGDIITISGEEARAYKNGEPCTDDEILGTEYFKSKPGANTIQFSFSNWVETNPDIKLFIREAWI